jgi:hypothetical protein
MRRVRLRAELPNEESKLPAVDKTCLGLADELQC